MGGSAVGLQSASSNAVQTVGGRVPAADLGVTLMHEHIVTDLRAPAERRSGDYDPADAFSSARPFLEALRVAGCQTLVEPTPIHIGRDVTTLQRLSAATGINIVCATGVYGSRSEVYP